MNKKTKSQTNHNGNVVNLKNNHTNMEYYESLIEKLKNKIKDLREINKNNEETIAVLTSEHKKHTSIFNQIKPYLKKLPSNLQSEVKTIIAGF